MENLISLPEQWSSWSVVKLLGAGSFAKVYLAVKEEYGEKFYCAIKHISITLKEQENYELYAEGMARNSEDVSSYYGQIKSDLIQEIKTNYTLRGNANIVNYSDHIVEAKPDGSGYDIYIMMEYLKSLTSVINETGGLSIDEIINLGIGICGALEVLSYKNIIHRDIKPGNIFVNDVGVYKLGDFGVSKVMDRTTSGMSIKGTMSYMAPEIFLRNKVDIRSDIYSLGLVLYRLLNNNKPPFIDKRDSKITYDDNMESFHMRVEGKRIPPPENSSNWNLVKVVLKACEFSPEKRWRTPTEMKGALLSIKMGKPVNVLGIEELEGDFTTTVDSRNSSIEDGYIYSKYYDYPSYERSIDEPPKEYGEKYSTPSYYGGEGAEQGRYGGNNEGNNYGYGYYKNVPPQDNPQGYYGDYARGGNGQNASDRVVYYPQNMPKEKKKTFGALEWFLVSVAAVFAVVIIVCVIMMFGFDSSESGGGGANNITVLNGETKESPTEETTEKQTDPTKSTTQPASKNYDEDEGQYYSREPSTEPITEKNETLICYADVNCFLTVRKSADTTSEPLAFIPALTSMTVIDETPVNGMILVCVNISGDVGYVNENYICYSMDSAKNDVYNCPLDEILYPQSEFIYLVKAGTKIYNNYGDVIAILEQDELAYIVDVLGDSKVTILMIDDEFPFYGGNVSVDCLESTGKS